MIKIAVCDDDKKFAEIFAQKISLSFAQHGQEVQATLFTSGIDLIEAVQQKSQYFTVIFLDVEMPEADGFQVAQKLRALDPAFILVFTTYIEHQSRKGYLYGAFRYVFKNNLNEELAEAVAGILQRLDKLQQAQQLVALKHTTMGMIENLSLPKSDILYLKTENNRRVTLQTTCATYNLLVKPLSLYAQILNPEVFVPIMRSYLVNFDKVESIDGEWFVLTGGARIPLGVKKSSKKSSMEKYMKYLRERI